MALKIAALVAFVRPAPPIMRIYIQEIVRILALPYGAAATGPVAEWLMVDG